MAKTKYKKVADMKRGDIFKANGHYFILTNERDKEDAIAICLDDALGDIHFFALYCPYEYEIVNAEIILKLIR